MAGTIEYRLLDVFTDVAYLGNPLAVVPDARSLTPAQMQAIAAELNLSETVFLRRPDREGDPWPTRIFTPAVELPFAGHPTIGAATVVADLLGGAGAVVLAEPAGHVSVTIEPGGRRATLIAPRLPEPLGAPAADAAAAALGLPDSELHPDLPVEGWSAGVPFTIVPVASASALASASIDRSSWEDWVAGTAAPDLYVITPGDTPARWRARMFGPGLGIEEDPATGAAACALAGWLARRDPSDGTQQHVIEQGVEMGRRSTLVLDLDLSGGEVREVRLTGSVAVVGSGQLVVP